MSNSSSANEVLLWPPPPETFEGTSDESTLFNHNNNNNDELANTTPTFDLFACIHTPGAEDDDVQVAPGGGLLEIHPTKVVFDNSSALYPSCTREVQKRIVSDLQRAYARTSQGRELAVKEWADGSQNRGILRLRLRCKKAKCRLQFQVNWETQLKHWFITRQCQNLVHTCPLPKPKSNSGNGNTSTNGGHKRKTSSLNGKNGTTKNVVEPPNEETSHTDLSAVVDMNGIHHRHHHRRDDSYYSGTVTPEAATSSAEWNDMVVCGNDTTGNHNHNNYNHHHDAIVPPPPPITSYNVVSNHHHSHHHPHNHSPYHDTTSYSTTNQDAGTSALAPAPSSMPHASVLSTVHHDAPAPPEVAVSSSEYYVPPAAAAAPVPHVVVTDADRAEAELLATDLRQWIPPPTTTTHGEMPPPLATTAITTSTAILGSSNNNSHPSQQDHLGVSASSPPLTLPLPLTTNAPAAAAATTLVPQQHVDPSFASVVTMPPQQHHHQLYDENHESLMPPPPMQSLSILNEIHYSMQQQQQQQLPPESAPAPHHVPSSFTAQPPAATIQIPTTISTITENHQHRYHPHHPVAPPSPMTPSRYLSGEFDSTEAAGMSIGANSTAMSIEQPNTPGGGGGGRTAADGDYNEEGEEKRGPSSGLYPHGETDGMSVLSESESNMMTLGSVSSKYWMNSLPNIPHANFSRLTSDNYNSIGSWFVDNKSSIGRRQTSQSNMPNTNNSNHTNNGGATGSTVYNNNFSINDLTMASLTDSVRNMLSIMEGGGTLIGTSGLMPTVGEIALDSDVVFGQVFSPTDVGSHEGGEVHAPSSSSSAQDPQQQQHHNHQPQHVQLYQQHPISHAQQQRPRPPPGPPPPRQGILAADFYTPPPNIGSPSQTHSVVAHHRPSASLS
ncbi:hypothetical protein ACA910_021329 [Epithemia clementina (nom. ined.)]